MANAVEHLKTLCCLGLPPESAMIALASAIREVIPAEWTRIGLHDHKLRPHIGYAEHPEFLPIFIDTFDQFMGDADSLLFGYNDNLRKNLVGSTLHRQGGAYLQSRYYNEFERRLDSCWLIEAAISDENRPIASLALSRHRSARPFSSKEAAELDAVRPWIAHALRDRVAQGSPIGAVEDETPDCFAAAPLHRASAIFDKSGRVLFQSPGCDHLFCILDRRAKNWHLAGAVRPESLAPIRGVINSLVGAARGKGRRPPRANIPTAWGNVTIEASWLAPAGTPTREIAANPFDTPVLVSLELHEHAIAHAARILRRRGATPTQVRVGVLLAIGKSKPQIAEELGTKLSSVVDTTRRLYERLDLHNASELGLQLWLDPATLTRPRAN
jgi:DNA-binding CsgD family transcriptional regulator